MFGVCVLYGYTWNTFLHFGDAFGDAVMSGDHAFQSHIVALRIVAVALVCCLRDILLTPGRQDVPLAFPWALQCVFCM